MGGGPSCCSGFAEQMGSVGTTRNRSVLPPLKGIWKCCKWLVEEKGCAMDGATCRKAAEGGHLHLLQWAHAKKGCPCDAQVCMRAADRGDLEMLQWLRGESIRCPWDEHTCRAAAKRGHLHVLKWARERGCPWDKRSWLAAAEGGHLEVLKWLTENGCPLDPSLNARGWSAHKLALTRGHGGVCKWLEEVAAELTHGARRKKDTTSHHL